MTMNHDLSSSQYVNRAYYVSVIPVTAVQAPENLPVAVLLMSGSASRFSIRAPF